MGAVLCTISGDAVADLSCFFVSEEEAFFNAMVTDD